ncbi:hypothetical protein STEG23_029855 [Scotinomys teguina]
MEAVARQKHRKQNVTTVREKFGDVFFYNLVEDLVYAIDLGFFSFNYPIIRRSGLLMVALLPFYSLQVTTEDTKTQGNRKVPQQLDFEPMVHAPLHRMLSVKCLIGINMKSK